MKKITDRPCHNNPGITCDHPKNCAKCGWNPYVDLERKEHLNERLDAEREKKRIERMQKASKKKADQSYFQY